MLSSLSPTELIVHVTVVLFYSALTFSILNVDTLTFFHIHPITAILAYGVFMSEGFLVSKKIKGKDKTFWLQIHSLFQIIAAVLSIIAFSVIFYNKILSGKSHFSSYHGVTGLTTFVLTISQTIGGLCLYYLRSRIIKIGGVRLLLTITKLHSQSGVIVFGLGGISMILGVRSNFAVRHFGAENSLILAVLVGLAILLSVSINLKSSSPVSPSSPSKDSQPTSEKV